MKQLELDYKKETGLLSKENVWVTNELEKEEWVNIYTNDFVEYLENKIYELQKQLHENTGKETGIY